MDTIGERIKIMRQQQGLTMADIAERIGVTKASMSSYENNKYYPSAQIIVKLCELFKVTADWLLTGTVGVDTLEKSSPEPQGQNEYERIAAETCLHNLTVDQAALINCYEKLDPSEKEDIWAMIKHKLSRKTGLDSSSLTSKDGLDDESKTA